MDLLQHFLVSLIHLRLEYGDCFLVILNNVLQQAILEPKLLHLHVPIFTPNALFHLFAALLKKEVGVVFVDDGGIILLDGQRLLVALRVVLAE